MEMKSGVYGNPKEYYALASMFMLSIWSPLLNSLFAYTPYMHKSTPNICSGVAQINPKQSGRVKNNAIYTIRQNATMRYF